MTSCVVWGVPNAMFGVPQGVNASAWPPGAVGQVAPLAHVAALGAKGKVAEAELRDDFEHIYDNY